MTEAQPVADNRLQRRKMRTRAALIRAAQAFVAAGKLNVPVLEKLTGEGEDPAETFARSFRLVGQLFRRRPEMSRVLLNTGLTLISADRGLAPRALRDIDAATRAGRFSVDDPMLALAVAGGALMGLGQLLHDQPERDDAETADRVTRDVLIMFGLP